MIHMLPSTATYRKVRAGRSVHLLHGLLAYRTYNPPELLYTQFTLCMSVHCCLLLVVSLSRVICSAVVEVVSVV
jgi:hypothetical protein